MCSRSSESEFGSGPPRCEETTDQKQGSAGIYVIYTGQIENQLRHALTQGTAEKPFDRFHLRAVLHAPGKMQDHDVRFDVRGCDPKAHEGHPLRRRRRATSLTSVGGVPHSWNLAAPMITCSQ